MKMYVKMIVLTEYALYEIRLQIMNVNIDEMLNVSPRNELVHIFERELWPEATEKLYITHMRESKAPKPNETSG